MERTDDCKNCEGEGCEECNEILILENNTSNEMLCCEEQDLIYEKMLDVLNNYKEPQHCMQALNHSGLVLDSYYNLIQQWRIKICKLTFDCIRIAENTHNLNTMYSRFVNYRTESNESKIENIKVMYKRWYIREYRSDWDDKLCTCVYNSAHCCGGSLLNYATKYEYICEACLKQGLVGGFHIWGSGNCNTKVHTVADFMNITSSLRLIAENINKLGELLRAAPRSVE